MAGLFQKGEDKLLKKIAEEAGEVIIAAKNNAEAEIIWEVADLWFHSLLVLGWHEIAPAKVFEELKKRHLAKE